jgi:hypothetical protein
MNYERLDEVATALKGNKSLGNFGVLSTGEKLYVALAANREDLLKAVGYSMVEAMARLEESELSELIFRWRYKG